VVFADHVSNLFGSNAMKNFLQRHRDEILGVLSGFDRIRFRGSLLLFQSEGSVCGWLKRIRIAFKDCKHSPNP
jgi:hypothetical protein